MFLDVHYFLSELQSQNQFVIEKKMMCTYSFVTLAFIMVKKKILKKNPKQTKISTFKIYIAEGTNSASNVIPHFSV